MNTKKVVLLSCALAFASAQAFAFEAQEVRNPANPASPSVKITNTTLDAVFYTGSKGRCAGTLLTNPVLRIASGSFVEAEYPIAEKEFCVGLYNKDNKDSGKYNMIEQVTIANNDGTLTRKSVLRNPAVGLENPPVVSFESSGKNAATLDINPR